MFKTFTNRAIQHKSSKTAALIIPQMKDLNDRDGRDLGWYSLKAEDHLKGFKYGMTSSDCFTESSFCKRGLRRTMKSGLSS